MIKFILGASIVAVLMTGGTRADDLCPLPGREGTLGAIYYDGVSDKLRRFAVARARHAAPQALAAIRAEGLRVHGREVQTKVAITEHPTRENHPRCVGWPLKPHIEDGRILIPAPYAELVMMRVEDWHIAEALIASGLPGLLLGRERSLDLVRCGFLTLNFDHTIPPELRDICGSAWPAWLEAYGAIRGDAAAMEQVAEWSADLLAMAIGHEYGHLLLGHVLSGDMDDARRRQQEIEADVFTFRAFSRDAGDGSGFLELMMLFTLDQDILAQGDIEAFSRDPRLLGLTPRERRRLGHYVEGRCRAGEVLQRVGINDLLTAGASEAGIDWLTIGVRAYLATLKQISGADVLDAVVDCGTFSEALD